MKLFLLGLGSMRREQIDVARALKAHHEIQYWVRMKKYFSIDEEEFSGTVFHEYFDTMQGRSASGMNDTAPDPWGADDIKSYADTESEFMSMADKWYPDWPVNQRKEFYYALLAYWGALLQRFRPDCIVMTSVPHEMYTFVIYAIAKRRSIRTLIIDDTVLDSDRSVLVEDYTKGSPALARAAQEGEGTLDELSEEMRAYYLRMTQSADPAPPLMETFFKTHTPLSNLRRWGRVFGAFVKDGTIWQRAPRKILRLLQPDLLDEYKRWQRPADLDRPFVYFPLHYQPELTTSPSGGIYVDQLLAIKTAAAGLPEGWELYVKEHPAQVGVHGGRETPVRYLGYYHAIASIPGVRLVPIRTNTFVLLDNARTTATITGTAAWESILRGKCALVFGYPWFMHAPGIMRVASVAQCRDAFAHVARGARPRQGEVLRYLRVLDRVALRVYLQTLKPGREDAWRSLAQAILKTLASFASESR